jgi:hypothetical protein
MEVANPQRMGDGVSLVNPTALRSDDNPSAPHPQRINSRSSSSFHRGAEPAQIDCRYPTLPISPNMNPQQQPNIMNRAASLLRGKSG